MKIEDVPIPPAKKVIAEKEFDLEKWRKEAPLDYYVIARLMTVDDRPTVRNALFNKVYPIVQLHIPDTLYKYISLTGSTTSDEKRFDALLKSRLFLSKVSSFNDPFDCKAYYYSSFRIFETAHFSTKKNPDLPKECKKREEFRPEMWYNLITTKKHTKQDRRNSSWWIIQQKSVF